MKRVRIKNSFINKQLFLILRRLLIHVAFFFCFFGHANNTLFARENNDLPVDTSNTNLDIECLVSVFGVFNKQLIFAGSNSDSVIEFRYIVNHTKYPYIFRLSIILQNKSDKKLYTSLGDSLFFELRLTPEKNGSNKPEPRKGKDLNTEELLFIANEKGAGLHNRYHAIFIISPLILSTNEGSTFLTSDHSSFNPADLDKFSLSNVSSSLVIGLPLPVMMPGEERAWELTLFYGPKSLIALTSGPVNLRALLFAELPTWMRWICFGLLGLLNAIFYVVPNWGISIIILAIIIRLFLYPIAHKGMKSQQYFAEMQNKMLPELAEIKMNYKGGEQSERIIELYKKYGVSPFAGLKPLLIVLLQLPILIALYHVLASVYEFRDAEFLWVDSLAEPDQLIYLGINIPVIGSYLNLLPILMSTVSLLSLRVLPLNPAGKEKKGSNQNIVMVIMIIMFFILFYSFPSGMVLYWTFSNLLHLAQQKIMFNKRIDSAA